MPLDIDKNHIRAAFEGLFDSIYVVSLPQSIDRREHVVQHFSSLGLSEYVFFDAYSADSPQVDKAFSEGLVRSFPPCFRCGKASCGSDECNNVLIPPQVANFLSYVRLWHHIANQSIRALVVEDDVVFQPYAADTLDLLKREVKSGHIQFEADVPKLLRMGWALCGEHSAEIKFDLRDVVRMSNPCHALTSAYARKLLSQYKGIYTTSDIFLHRDSPREGEALTVFPPVAAELSWSTGAVSSLIHPKLLRSEFLRHEGNDAAADANDRAIETHVSHMYYRPVLVVGHPRTGTGFAAAILRQCGLDIGHEADGADGLSSWMFAVDDVAPYYQHPVAKRRGALKWDVLVHPVRDINTAVASVMRDDSYAPPSYAYRRKHILARKGIDLNACRSALERAVMSIGLWDELIAELDPDINFRIEDQVPEFLRFLKGAGLGSPPGLSSLDLSPVNADKAYQGRFVPKPNVQPADWASLSQDAWSRVVRYCEAYGYELPERLLTQHQANGHQIKTDVEGLRRLFLQPSGWARSKKESRPVGPSGSPLPWFTFGAIEFLHRVVSDRDRVFEYGAGYSTLWWQETVREVVSVDHDPEWCSELIPQLGANTKLIQVSEATPWPSDASPWLDRFFRRPRRTHWPEYDDARVVRRGLADEAFKAYAATILEHGPPFDFVVIDGMARRLCTEFAVDCIKDDGIIILDNSNRRDYDAAYDILEQHRFYQIPFWGLVPGADFMTCTSIFFKIPSRLPSARHQANVLDLPEY